MRLVLSVLWILLGGALSGAVYWAFLSTPESTVWALIVSAVLAIVGVTLVGLTITGAITIWSDGLSKLSIMRAVRAIPSIVPALVIVLIVWYLTLRAETWVAMRNGQINAWFVAQFGWADVSWLFRTVRYVANWLRWIVASMLALSLMAGFVTIGARALSQSTWVRRALQPRALVLTTLLFIVLIALPWKYVVPWRPATLPPTSIELVFTITKLSLTALLFAIASALIVRSASVVTPARDSDSADI